MNFDINIKMCTEEELNNDLYTIFFPEYVHLRHQPSGLLMPDLYSYLDFISFCGKFSYIGTFGRSPDIFPWSFNSADVDCPMCLSIFAMHSLRQLP